MKIHRVLITAIALFVALQCVAFGADDPMVAVDRKIAELTAMTGVEVANWRSKIGEVPDAQDPALDDSAWHKSKKLEFIWGDQPLAWLRTRIVLPESVGGMPVAGSAVVFRCGVDDDGILYVNGKEAQRFHWDGGSVVLTENAKAGDTFDIAIKGINSGGPGRLLTARLEYSAFRNMAGRIGAFLDSYRQARSVYDVADPAKRAPYLPIIADAVGGVDLDALKAGRFDDFRESLVDGQAKLAQVGELTAGINAFLVGHAHIDMNWLWLWPETLDVCKNTFTSMCNLIDQYPDFRFSQDQPATYYAMQKTQPALFERIKGKIKSGQWEVTGSCWTEGDLNMSSGESIVRGILYGKRYMKQQFGVETVVGWEPDTFGHPWTIPQIFAKSGIKYYYFMRANPSAPLFWWEGPDGSRLLAYSFDPYNLDVSEDGVSRDALRFAQATGVSDYMRVYGVGDHGGGPTKQMVETAVSLQGKPNYPTVKFSSAAGYFDAAAKSGRELPVWKSEMNTVFEGCYTTHADAKRWNRESENLIPCAEKFASIASGFGLGYPSTDFLQSWRNTCFNQFHDILCGSAIHGSYDYSRKLYLDAVGKAKAALDKSLATLSSKIATSGAGVPVVVYNSLGWVRTDAVEVATPFPGEHCAVRVSDGSGKEYVAQTIGDKLRFTARDVPAMGYKVFWVSRSSKPLPSGVSVSNTKIENQFFRVTLDPKDGVITSIYDKLNKREVLPAGAKGALFQALYEEPHGMSAWGIGPISKVEDIVGKGEVVMMNSGPARGTVTLDHDFGPSHFVMETTLHDAVPRIDLRITASWEAVGGPGKATPMVKLAFPTALKDAKATFDIPFGSIERPANGAEVPAQKWIDLSQPGYGVSLLNNCKYGFDVNKNVMRATLLRSPYEPDPRPDQGPHEMTFSIYPHKGDWRAAGTVKRAYELNEPLIAKVVKRHSGSLPSAKSFVSVSEPGVVVTALKKAEDDGSLILRFYESQGKACQARVKMGIPAKYVIETDLMERPVGKKQPVSNGSFTVNVGKWEIKTYKLLSQ